MTTYTFFHDPGHGWLAVPRSELQALGIEGSISRYSYQSRDGATCYLEEDCDYARFAIAKGWDKQRPAAGTVIEQYIEGPMGEGFVRGLPMFRASQVPA